MFKNAFAAVLAGSALLIPAQAQIRGTIAATPSGTSFAGIRSFHSPGEGPSHLPGYPGARHVYPPVLLGAPYYFADFGPQPVVSEGAPQVIVVQVPSPASYAEPAKQSAVQPLVIELRGDRYVRLNQPQGNETQAKGEAEVQSDDAESAVLRPEKSAKHMAHPQPPIPDLQPVVLVYRDGHREQVRDYTIADGVLYASGDYWTDGYWTRKIQLASLNLPATQHASLERGVQFILPDSPNEVITRP